MKGMKTLEKNLLKLKEEILKDIDENIKTERSSTERDVGDFYDEAESEKGRQLTYMLGERDRKKLDAINTALEKIEDETYGICEECGEKIDKKRLNVLPFAKYCVSCQSDMEKKGVRIMDNSEDSMIYKDISINDIDASDE